MRLALDVMGGDLGSRVVVEGLRAAMEEGVSLDRVYLAGDRDAVLKDLKATGLNDGRVEVKHASEVLTMRDKPTDGLRKKKNCSLAVAVDLVREGEADAVVSLGNTGGLVAVASVRLRPMPGVDRPAIATVIPAPERHFVLLDSGATTECKPAHLLQFAVMGDIYAREILGYERPRVGILSNGTEENKGTELTREASALCRRAPFRFVGHVEGHDLFANKVDVVVTDGFTGNIVLKTCESMGKGILRTLRSEMTANPLRKLGAFLARGAFTGIKRQMDAEIYGGAPLLGLNGQVIKAHGSARPRAIKNAIRAAKESVAHEMGRMIQEQLQEIERAAASSEPEGRTASAA